MKKTLTKSYKNVLEEISRATRVVLTTHVNPDPDALASMLALAQFLKRQGKKVRMFCSESVPARFAFLPGCKKIEAATQAKLPVYDLAIVVDCGDVQRIGRVRNLLSENKPLINIDHHITNDFFGTMNLVNPEASSTAEVIYDLCAQAKFTLTKDMALLLYVGVMTDTGSFRYDNTTAHTHEVVGKLMAYGLPIGRLYTRLYETIPLSDIKSFNQLMKSFEVLCAGKVICLELTQRAILSFSEDFDLRDKIFRYLRAIKGVELLIILTEEGEGKTRVNFRSQTCVDVARLAFQFNGGGHSRASGCLIEEDIPTARAMVLKAVRHALASDQVQGAL